jgi:hypothetical protein
MSRNNYNLLLSTHKSRIALSMTASSALKHGTTKHCYLCMFEHIHVSHEYKAKVRSPATQDAIGGIEV